MSHHEMHAVKHLVEHTSAGKHTTAAAVTGVVAAAKVIGLGSLAAAAAPIAVPMGIIAGLTYLATKDKKTH